MNNSQSEVKRLTRSKSNQVIAGISSGLGNYLNLDPIVIRIVFVLLAMAGGLGFLIYLILWILIPNTSTQQYDQVLKENITEIKSRAQTTLGRTNSAAAAKSPRQMLGAMIISFGILILLKNLGFEFISMDKVWPVLVIIVGFYLFKY